MARCSAQGSARQTRIDAESRASKTSLTTVCLRVGSVSHRPTMSRRPIHASMSPVDHTAAAVWASANALTATAERRARYRRHRQHHRRLQTTMAVTASSASPTPSTTRGRGWNRDQHPVHRWHLTASYLGRPFAGWQRHSTRKTCHRASSRRKDRRHKKEAKAC